MSQEEWSAAEIESKLRQAILGRQGSVTVGDVSADTGIPLESCESALRSMLSTYKSHLDVDDDGNLRYRFDPAMIRRGEIPGLRWHRIKEGAWTAFQWLFKVWIMVMLVGYTIVFLLLLLALAVAALAATKGEDDGLAILPLRLFAEVLETLFWISLFEDDRNSSRRQRGRRRSRRQRVRRRKIKPEKAFYQKIFDYVFGPQYKGDPLAIHQRFASFVRSRRGRITAADWAQQTGQSLREADEALTAAMLRFRGDVDVSEEGVLVYRFDDLSTSANGGTEEQLQFPSIWERPVVLPPLTGNPTSSNAWISSLGGFNLMMSIAVLATVGGGWGAGIAVLGWIPLVFSALFFSVPLVRKVRRSGEQKRAGLENRRRQQMRLMYRGAKNDAHGLMVLDPDLIQGLSADYAGELDVTSQGETVSSFPELSLQLKASTEAFESADDGIAFGTSVFSSEAAEQSVQEDLDEFDRRLALDLQSSHAFSTAKGR